MEESNHFFMINRGYVLQNYVYYKTINSFIISFSPALINMSTRKELEKSVEKYEKEAKEDNAKNI